MRGEEKKIGADHMAVIFAMGKGIRTRKAEIKPPCTKCETFTKIAEATKFVASALDSPNHEIQQ
jgi:hypothetical protein